MVPRIDQNIPNLIKKLNINFEKVGPVKMLLCWLFDIIFDAYNFNFLSYLFQELWIIRS